MSSDQPQSQPVKDENEDTSGADKKEDVQDDEKKDEQTEGREEMHSTSSSPKLETSHNGVISTRETRQSIEISQESFPPAGRDSEDWISRPDTKPGHSDDEDRIVQEVFDANVRSPVLPDSRTGSPRPEIVHGKTANTDGHYDIWIRPESENYSTADSVSDKTTRGQDKETKDGNISESLSYNDSDNKSYHSEVEELEVAENKHDHLDNKDDLDNVRQRDNLSSENQTLSYQDSSHSNDPTGQKITLNMEEGSEQQEKQNPSNGNFDTTDNQTNKDQVIDTNDDMGQLVTQNYSNETTDITVKRKQSAANEEKHPNDESERLEAQNYASEYIDKTVKGGHSVETKETDRNDDSRIGTGTSNDIDTFEVTSKGDHEHTQAESPQNLESSESDETSRYSPLHAVTTEHGRPPESTSYEERAVSVQEKQSSDEAQQQHHETDASENADAPHHDNAAGIHLRGEEDSVERFAEEEERVDQGEENNAEPQAAQSDEEGLNESEEECYADNDATEVSSNKSSSVASSARMSTPTSCRTDGTRNEVPAQNEGNNIKETVLPEYRTETNAEPVKQSEGDQEVSGTEDEDQEAREDELLDADSLSKEVDPSNNHTDVEDEVDNPVGAGSQRDTVLKVSEDAEPQTEVPEREQRSEEQSTSVEQTVTEDTSEQEARPDGTEREKKSTYRNLETNDDDPVSKRSSQFPEHETEKEGKKQEGISTEVPSEESNTENEQPRNIISNEDDYTDPVIPASEEEQTRSTDVAENNDEPNNWKAVDDLQFDQQMEEENADGFSSSYKSDDENDTKSDVGEDQIVGENSKYVETDSDDDNNDDDDWKHDQHHDNSDVENENLDDDHDNDRETDAEYKEIQHESEEEGAATDYERQMEDEEFESESRPSGSREKSDLSESRRGVQIHSRQSTARSSKNNHKTTQTARPVPLDNRANALRCRALSSHRPRSEYGIAFKPGTPLLRKRPREPPSRASTSRPQTTATTSGKENAKDNTTPQSRGSPRSAKRPKSTRPSTRGQGDENDGRSRQKEFFKVELERIEKSLARESSKIHKPPMRKNYPYVFNDLEPYYNTHTAKFLIYMPDEVRHGYVSRSTAGGLIDPWEDLRMDRTVLPRIASRPVTRAESKGGKRGNSDNQRPPKEGSTRLPKFPVVNLETSDLTKRQLYFSDVPMLRQELKDKYSANANKKIEADYERTKQDYYRMELDKMEEIHPLNRPHMRKAYFAYLQNTPGSRKAIHSCVKKSEKAAN